MQGEFFEVVGCGREKKKLKTQLHTQFEANCLKRCNFLGDGGIPPTSLPTLILNVKETLVIGGLGIRGPENRERWGKT